MFARFPTQQRSIAVGCVDLAVLLRRKKDPGRAQWLEGQLTSGLPVTTDPKPSSSPLLIKQLRDIVGLRLSPATGSKGVYGPTGLSSFPFPEKGCRIPVRRGGRLKG